MTTTMGLKLSDDQRARLKACSERAGRTPHFLAKQALLGMLDRIERGDVSEVAGATVEAEADAVVEDAAPHPFLAFAQGVQPQSALRACITAAWRRPEPECLPYLIAQAAQTEAARRRTEALAATLVDALRRRGPAGGAESLLEEYALSSQEGVALMCLAEALLRIPDAPTRDALIRDKIAAGDWQAHVGQSPSLFVNAATWGLVLTGKLATTQSETGLTSAIGRVIGRGGEPIVRRGVAMAMRLMGEQFVTGQTIAEALANSHKREARGFTFSYDMLGEAATTMEDADRYFGEYERAIRAIGRAAAGRGIHAGPGISIKLSALHPRYGRAQQERVMAELLPRLGRLAVLARQFDIGLNIDAEEADRLELSLDLLEALCFDARLAGWNGIGFVVQAYGKRCPFVIDWLIDLARRSRHRLMVRLVKGAYWDSEIKRAQIDGLEGFPVYTRKLYTDVSYLACARRLLAAPDAIYPQFATHNAQTLAAVYTMAEGAGGAAGGYAPGQYEFQCLHGMGEALYDEVVGAGKLDRPCRIYAPVGTHETLLAYLVRRLLENGANTSFVNRIADQSVPIADLVADPVAQAAAEPTPGAPHPRIALPRDLFGQERRNSSGIDLTNEQSLASLSAALLAGAETPPETVPFAGGGVSSAPRPILNPANRRDRVGKVREVTEDEARAAARLAATAGTIWASTPAGARADCLTGAADVLEARMPHLIGPIVREAGKTLPAAVAEIREAVDFLRYYAGQVRGWEPGVRRALGPVVCISPWNFPLAIFTGQVAACLAAGNSVLAKPAEQTPLIATAMVGILHESGVPADVLQLVPGEGTIGAALVAAPDIRGVVFTGSTDVARLIQRGLAGRLAPSGQPIPLIAETGGLNAMIVDSSALAEQVVGDVLSSAFDSAGQRCSALRILCLQEDSADRILHMLKGAMRELRVGAPDNLATDVGPVIDEAARAAIVAHVEAMQVRGFRVTAAALPEECRQGTFVAPTLIEIGGVADAPHEVFGPVLHVLRYRRAGLDALIDQINAAGYGLTFGLHTRIDETIARVCDRIHAGNIYINRNIVGAVVGVQPFGGEGLSGTGPKAGGPLYLERLVEHTQPGEGNRPNAALAAYGAWLRTQGDTDLAATCLGFAVDTDLTDLPGPVGERNTYVLRPMGRVLCVAATRRGALLQIGAALAAGNTVLLDAPGFDLPPRYAERTDWHTASEYDAVLFEGDSDRLVNLQQALADREGPLVRVQATQYDPKWLMHERCIATNTAAAGGNANLMSIG